MRARSILLIGIILGACSSAPKRPVQVVSTKQLAENQLQLVNTALDRGNFENALKLLTEARRLAVSTDDPNLRARTKLAEGNILAALSRTTEAEAAWNEAQTEAEDSGDTELAAQTRIYLARNSLLTKKSKPASVKDSVTKDLALLKTNRLARALGWTVLGLADKDSGAYGAAEASFKKALEIHAKDNYLEDAAYDWFLIGSVRSQAKDYAGAIEALNSSIEFDRRAENTFGLGSTWKLMGDVHKKFGNSAEAEKAFARSAEIFSALNIGADKEE